MSSVALKRHVDRGEEQLRVAQRLIKVHLLLHINFVHSKRVVSHIAHARGLHTASAVYTTLCSQASRCGEKGKENSIVY
jgi:hypothetical protein